MMNPFLRILLSAALLFTAQAASGQHQALVRHARSAPDSLRHNLPRLLEYLLRPAESQAEQALVLYTWLTHNIDYDDEARRQGRRINQDIGDILRRGRALCFGYSQLYAELCRLAGLRCVSVSGYARQGLGPMELPGAPDHSWNAIFLDGQWQLVDATWGAHDGADAFTSTYDAGYFLTPPRLFILNHLPALPMWQLLPCPVKPEAYSGPAESLLLLIGSKAPCYSFADSIEAFLHLPMAEQRLQEAAATYRFHSSKDNQRAWAQAMIDYAVHLSERSTALQQADSLEAAHTLLRHAIGYCQKAQALGPSLPWQTEFYAGLLINQAVAFNRESSNVKTVEAELEKLRAAQQSLEQALEVLAALPEDNYYRQYAGQQCAAYLEAVRHNIGRLE